MNRMFGFVLATWWKAARRSHKYCGLVLKRCLRIEFGICERGNTMIRHVREMVLWRSLRRSCWISRNHIVERLELEENETVNNLGILNTTFYLSRVFLIKRNFGTWTSSKKAVISRLRRTLKRVFPIWRRAFPSSDQWTGYLTYVSWVLAGGSSAESSGSSRAKYRQRLQVWDS